jgi:hypothetical protein
LGSAQFVERMQALIDFKQPLQEIPRRQRRALAKPSAYYASRYRKRDRAVAEAYRTGAYGMQTIGEHFGVSRMTVSRAVNNNEKDISVVTDVTCEIPSSLFVRPLGLVWAKNSNTSFV